MAMMVVDSDVFEKEALRLSAIEPKQEIKVVDISRGRPIGRLEVPHELRVLVASDVINGAPASEISKAYGVSPSSISAYKNGATSTTTYNKPDESLARANNFVKETITDSARSALQAALAEITPDKLSLAKVRDAAGIAKDMSAVMKNLEPTNPQQQNNVQVVIYKPRTKDEDSYETITVNE